MAKLPDVKCQVFVHPDYVAKIDRWAKQANLSRSEMMAAIVEGSIDSDEILWSVMCSNLGMKVAHLIFGKDFRLSKGAERAANGPQNAPDGLVRV